MNLDGKIKVNFRDGGGYEEGLEQDLMIHNLEEVSIGVIDGKKRQCMDVLSDRVFEILYSEEKKGEHYLAYQENLSTTTRG